VHLVVVEVEQRQGYLDAIEVVLSTSLFQTWLNPVAIEVEVL
jgi:hypothetical protein